MKILIRSHERKNEWEAAKSLTVAAEAELQILLA